MYSIWQNRQQNAFALCVKPEGMFEDPIYFFFIHFPGLIVNDLLMSVIPKKEQMFSNWRQEKGLTYIF